MFFVALCAAQVSRAQVQLTDSQNFFTGFEIDEGYSSGFLQSDPNWYTDGSPLPLLGSFGHEGNWGVELGTYTNLSIDFWSDSVATVGWVDFYVKPGFTASSDLPTSFSLGQAALTGFVKVGVSGEIYVLHGDGLGNGTWMGTEYFVPVVAGLASDWLRMTYRLDYGSQRWDLYLDDSLQMIDLGFIDANAPPLSGFSIEGSTAGETYFDQFEAGFLNPLFTDVDNDGIADSYETAQGLNVALNDRSADADSDTLSNVFEYMSGSEAGNPDSDGDGVHDGIEVMLGASPIVADAYDLEDIPYLEAFESMLLGNLEGQGFWQVGGVGAVILQSETVYEGLQALKIEAAEDERIEVQNAFDGSANAHIWVDFWTKPVLYPVNTEIDLSEMELLGSSVFFLKEAGKVCVLDGDHAGGGTWNDLPYAVSGVDWVRITIYKDYGAQVYSLWIDGVRVAADQGFAYTQPYFDGICFNHEGEEATYIDRLAVSFDKVAGLDTDGDGLLDESEDANGNGVLDLGETDPYLADTDGDELADSLELKWGFDPLVVDTSGFSQLLETDASKIWSAAFSGEEGYLAGNLDNQLKWLADGAVDVTLGEELKVQSSSTISSSFEHLFGVDDEKAIWVSFRAKLVIGEMPTVENLSNFGGLAFGYTRTSELSVWSHLLNGWEMLLVSAAGDEWNHYALHLDYTSKTWKLVINGKLIAEGLSLGADPAYVFSQFKVLQQSIEEGESQLSNFDDLVISTGEPAGLDFDDDGLINSIERGLGSNLLSSDSDGDGMDDFWEYQSGLDLLLDDSLNDLDSDGLVNLYELFYGFDPQVLDVEGATGFVNQEIWNNTSGNSLSGLTNDTRYPLSPSSRKLLRSLTTEYSRDESYYGQRIRGIITAPVTGDYTFWISSDDQSELWLSSDESAFSKTRIAHVSQPTSFKQWDLYSTQRSASIRLVEGEKYCIEVLHQQGVGGNHVSVAWQFPGQSLEIVPSNVLSTIIKNPNDLDEDGLPDDWEQSVGLSSSYGHGIHGYAGDVDFDGLLNYEERLLSTDPLVADSDGDGVSDLQEYKQYLSDPLSFDIGQVYVVEEIDLRSGIAVNGGWATDINGVHTTTATGTYRVGLDVSAPGLFELEVDALGYQRIDDEEDFEVMVYVDGQYVDQLDFWMPKGGADVVAVLLPWLDVGSHNLDLRFVNFKQSRQICFTAARLQSYSGPDLDLNGRPDWIDTRLALLNGIECVTSSSLVSPFCLEGRSRYSSMASIGGDTVFAAPSNRWFTNIDLNPEGSVITDVSFENGALSESCEMAWTETNILNVDSGIIRIRKGDSLLLNAHPDGISDGDVIISIEGQTYTSTVDEAIPTLFDSAGTYVVDGEWSSVEGLISGQIVVEVVEASFPNSPIVAVGYMRDWKLPNINTDLAVEVDSRLSAIDVTPTGASGSVFSISTDSLEPCQVAVRLDPSGPILAVQQIRGVRTATNEATGYSLLEAFDDGSMLFELIVAVSDVYPELGIRMEIFAGGVLFDDGSRSQLLTAEHFNELGLARVYMVRPESAKTSFCNRAFIYEEDVLIGQADR